jgi:branched-chain amino acid transport system permease protein
VCLLSAALLYLVIHKTRLGMMIRAGSSNRDMAASLGVNIGALFALVFASGVALAAFAGAIAAPLSSVFPGMGNQILIICFVVVVIGGIGSINGALIASLAVGLADTLGKVVAAEYSSMAVYLVMAAILLWRPQGIANKV